jgi:thymidylate synthase
MPYIFTDAKHPDEEYTYGQDLTWQAEWCIKHYKEEGLGTNHCYMTVGRPEALRNYERPGGTTQCLRGIDTKIVAGQLHFRIYYRSWDLWGALSMNLAAFELLKQYMASQIGVENGCMIFASKGLHIYDESWKYAAERCQKPLPEYLEKILEQKRQETE